MNPKPEKKLAYLAAMYYYKNVASPVTQNGDSEMAMQKVQMRKLAEIGAYLLRWYSSEQTTEKSALKYSEVDENIRRMFTEDQLEFEFEVRGNDEKVKIV